MTKNIFINLPVKDLAKSVAFFKNLGLKLNSDFTDNTAACLVIGDHFYAMLLTYDKFAAFTKKAIVDAKKATEVLIAFDVDSRQQVDSLITKALKAGGKSVRPPEDYGWMYGQSFEDLDGHIWEIFWSDLSQKP